MKPLHVLIVEDNPADAKFVSAMLDSSEYVVSVTGSIGEAVGLVRHARFDVALLDTSLPDGSGIEALRRLREAEKALPVVMIGGAKDEPVSAAAVAAGAQDYLLKGYVTEAALRRVLRFSIERHELTVRLAASIEELERQRASVLGLNQLKNDLIAVLAHDIKGPLTSIIGFAELLEEGYLEGAASTDAAHTIRMNAHRLATLANDVLALSRVEHGELEITDERVDLRELLRASIEAHRSEREIEFECAIDEALVRGDESRLRQAFDNLLRNAIKYSTGGEPVVVKLERDGETFRTSIVDRGIGIPPEDVPRLFERFSRGSNAKRAKIAGTGIGLFIVRMIVERHGGSIGVESSLGEGSTFTVTLPSIESAASRIPMRVTILTADQGLSRFAAYELRSRGYRVREASNIDDLAHVGDVRAGDVILVDRVTATEQAVRELAPKGSSIRIVGIDVDGIDGEWDDVLPRPFLVTDLITAVGPGELTPVLS